MIFLEAVLVIETIWGSQSNLEEKDNSSILKFDFASSRDPIIFSSIGPVQMVKRTSWVFFSNKSKLLVPTPPPHPPLFHPQSTMVASKQYL